MPLYSREKKLFLQGVTRRFIRIADLAIKAGKAENDSDLCTKIGMDKERMSEIRSGRTLATLYFIARLSDLSGRSTDEIIKG